MQDIRLKRVLIEDRKSYAAHRRNDSQEVTHFIVRQPT